MAENRGNCPLTGHRKHETGSCSRLPSEIWISAPIERAMESTIFVPSPVSFAETSSPRPTPSSSTTSSPRLFGSCLRRTRISPR